MCHDAIGAIFTRIRFRPQYALKLDRAKCFDRIAHDALLAKVQAPPLIRRHRKAWLKAGILEDGHLTPPTAGTPQGGSISPLLALIALHGMEEVITQVYPQARVIAYADDGVVLHKVYVPVDTLGALTCGFRVITAALDNLVGLTSCTRDAIWPAQLADGLRTLSLIDQMRDMDLHRWTPDLEWEMEYGAFTPSSHPRPWNPT